MSVRVRVPVLLRNLTGGQAEVTVDGATVGEVLAALEGRYPGVRERLYDEQGVLRRFVNVYLNDKDIRTLEGEATPVADGDEVAIVPAIAGGS